MVGPTVVGDIGSIELGGDRYGGARVKVSRHMGCRAVPDSLYETKPRALLRSHQGTPVSVPGCCRWVRSPDGD